MARAGYGVEGLKWDEPDRVVVRVAAKNSESVVFFLFVCFFLPLWFYVQYTYSLALAFLPPITIW